MSPKKGSKSLFGAKTNATFGDGSEHARNAKELVVRMYDWFSVQLPKYEQGQNTVGIFAYAFDLSQNLFNASGALIGADGTKNRIKKVHLDVMTPGGPIKYTVPTGTGQLTETTSLPMVQSAVPCLEYESGTAGPAPSALIGQSTLVLHPDVRRPWQPVGKWDYTKMFRDTQIQPWYADTVLQAGFMELFRLQFVDGVTGDVLCNTPAPTPPLDYVAEKLQFRVMIEIACPVALIPEPARATGLDPFFSGASYAPTYTEDKSPMQFELVGLQNAL
jgi:hypothetical protein